ncbi:MAG TPA: cell division protein FtsL [Egibacteraceae bacterium]|nr:cell division protein FtsL [Egibacteraceae bacterium]
MAVQVSPQARARQQPTPGPPLPRPELRLLPPPRHPTRWVVVLLVVTVAGIFGVVALHALAAEQAFTARRLEAEADRLAMRHGELTAEVAVLRAPERLRRVATEELGMVPPRQPTFLVVPVARPGQQAGGGIR